MKDNKFELSEELLQRYYDGELDDQQNRDVQQALEQDAQASAALADYRTVGNLLRDSTEKHVPDELTEQRLWNSIEQSLARNSGKARVRKHAPWLGAVAAAAAIVLYISPFNIVPTAQAGNQLEIESIDCNYASFMLLPPEAEEGHTIIWINDPDSSE